MLRKEAQFYEINPLNYYKVSDTARQAVKKEIVPLMMML